tara:strand:- start:373 stop:912 length:540 start_codon:yes stop_codon:yes gene_type:complete
MIYKLACKDTNITDIYIGSTTNFYRRKSQHKNNCNNINSKSYNHYKYQFIRNNGDFENWDMVLVENISCENKRELEKIERIYIDDLKPTLNSNKSYTSQEEKKEYHKEYREKNEDKFKEYEKEYNKKNEDKLRKQKKEYKKKNKDRINQKINCPICNCLISRNNMLRHQRSKKCMSCKN